MKALVTGGAGFIGSHLCDRLLKEGFEVVCFDNLSTGKKENIEHLLNTNRFKFVLGDVRDIKEISIAMNGVDIVFNQMASKKTICEKSPFDDCVINAAGTLNVLLAMKKNGTRKIVHASTGSVYGSCNHRITEFTSTNPVSYYGVSKLAGEKYVAAFMDMFDFEYTILRYFHVYGGRQDSSDNGGVIPIFITKMLNGEPITIHGDGKQVRSFTFVDDVIEANIAGAINMDCRIYNCASGLKITINELVENLEGLIGKAKIKHAPNVLGDVLNFDVENIHIRKDLSIKFTNFDEGLKKTVKYYESL